MGVETVAHGEAVIIPERVRAKRTGVIRAFGPHLLSIILIALSIFLYLWTRVMVLTTNYEIGNLETKKKILTQENRELNLQMDTITTPMNLERLGLEELGLIFPDDSHIIPIK